MSLLGKILQGGAAYFQHATFIQAALNSSGTQRLKVVEEYVQGLTEISFNGLKAMLIMRANQENDSLMKQEIQLLLQNANAVRTGKPQDTKLSNLTTNTVRIDEFDRNVELVFHWLDSFNQEDRKIALADHLITLDSDGYDRFIKNVEEMKANLLESIRIHKANENLAWGPYFEDQMAYLLAKEQTGESDPEFMRVLREYEQNLEYIKWVIKSSNDFWPLIQQRRAAAGE